MKKGICMRWVSFFIILLFNFCVNAKSYNYITYHSIIAGAESALVKEDFKSSLIQYKKAFEAYPFKFACDIYHAMQVAVISASETDCRNLLDICLAYGISLKCLKNAPLIYKYLKTLSESELQQKEVFCCKRYKSKIDINLQDEWKERFNCEQTAKNSNDKSVSYLECLKDNYIALKKYISANRQYPGEKIIGICLPETSSAHWADDCNLENEFVTPTLLHTGISFADLKKDLDMCLENGSLNPRDYMYMLQFEKVTGKEQVGFKKYYSNHQQNIDFSCYSLCFNMGWGRDCEDNSFANECRKKIGVCAVETDARKKEIKKKYGFVFLNIIS